MSKLKYYLALGAFAILSGAIILAMINVIKGPTPARSTIRISAVDGYSEATNAAIDIWNGFVGCKFLIPVTVIGIKVPNWEVLIMSDDGAPCGDLIRPESECGHDATAYRCPGGGFQIYMSGPGDVSTQTAIIAHEIGHTLSKWGVEHATIGVMSRPKSNNTSGKNYLRIRDRDVAALKEQFCE